MTRREEIAARRRNTWIAVGLHSDKIVRDLREIVRLEKLGGNRDAGDVGSVPAPARAQVRGEPSGGTDKNTVSAEPERGSSC